MDPMTDRRGRVSLWTAYTVVFLITYFLYDGILVQLPILACVPICVPVAAAFVAVLEGSFAGSVFGLCIGLFQCLAQGGRGIEMILVGTLIGLLAGLLRELKPQKPFGACLFGAFAALVGTELVEILGRVIFSAGGSAFVLLKIAGVETLYSIVPAVVVYPLYAFVWRHLGSGS